MPKLLNFDEVQIGEPLGSFEYLFSQELLDRFREAVGDPTASFATLARKHDSTAYEEVYEDAPGVSGGINAGSEVEFYNPPVVGKKMSVTGRIVDKYIRRNKRYVVIEATAVDEDGRLIERVRTHSMKELQEVGKKWGR